MEALIGLMLLLAFLSTLDFSALFTHSKNYAPPANIEADREKYTLL
jgi:hypothetical protein